MRPTKTHQTPWTGCILHGTPGAPAAGGQLAWEGPDALRPVSPARIAAAHGSRQGCTVWRSPQGYLCARAAARSAAFVSPTRRWILSSSPCVGQARTTEPICVLSSQTSKCPPARDCPSNQLSHRGHQTLHAIVVQEAIVRCTQPTKESECFTTLQPRSACDMCRMAQMIPAVIPREVCHRCVDYLF